MDSNLVDKEYNSFIIDIKNKIRNSQYEAMKAVNKTLINLYWGIGKEIYNQQQEKGWGKSIVEVLASEIKKDFPDVQGFSARNLWNMRNFYIEYKDNEILQPLVAEFSWTKNIVIIEKCKEPLEREFYIRMTKRYGWTKDVLINHIENKSCEKYLLNQTNFDETLPEKYVNQAKLAVKDEYIFDFMELNEQHSEKELELSLVNNIICKSKNRTIVEYALNDSDKPIGVATYQIIDSLPEKMKDLLPSPKEIEKRLKDL